MRLISGRYYALSVMTMIYMVNFLDRGLIALLLQPIKQDLSLSDTQLGLLTGIAFAVFYSVAGVPISRWADRGNRVTIASLAIGLWGLTVMACFFVTSFPQLLVARVAAATGEAGCKPPLYSLIGDRFPEPAERTWAMTIFLIGAPLASLASFLLGGWLNAHYGWRASFAILGIPGLLLALLLKLTVKEPRSEAASSPTTAAAQPGFGSILARLWRQRTTRHLVLALTLIYTLGMGLTPWYAAFMIRLHGMDTAELGLWLGLIFGLSGLSGIIFGGYLSATLFAGDEKGQMRMSAVAIMLVAPCLIAFLTIQNRYGALCALIPLIAVFNLFLGPTYAILQRLVSDDMRATVLAMIMLIANLIGMGIGPLLVGVASDSLSAKMGADGLRYAMLAMSVFALWSGYHFWQAGRTVIDEIDDRA